MEDTARNRRLVRTATRLQVLVDLTKACADSLAGTLAAGSCPLCGRPREPGYNTWCRQCCALPRDAHGIPTAIDLRPPTSDLLQPAPDPLLSLCDCGHTFRAHDGHTHGHPCAVVGCPCKGFSSRGSSLPRTPTGTGAPAVQPPAAAPGQPERRAADAGTRAGIPCGATAPCASTADGSAGDAAVPGRVCQRDPSRGVRGDASPRPPEASPVPGGTRGEVLGFLQDLEDSLELGDLPRARQAIRHLRQALDALPF